MNPREKPRPILRKEAGGRLVPASSFDAELLAALPVGTELDVAERSRRSLPHHRLYWAALARVVEATDRWPTPEHLHAALKMELGYFTVWRDLAGRAYLVPDSTAFAAMSQADFKAYADKAFAAIAAATGIDPLAFMEEAA